MALPLSTYAEGHGLRPWGSIIANFSYTCFLPKINSFNICQNHLVVGGVFKPFSYELLPDEVHTSKNFKGGVYYKP